MLAACCAGVPGHTGHDRDAAARVEVLAPGYQALRYPPPPAGSYVLPPLFEAPDGAAVDADGRAVTLHGVFDGRIAVLSFIYSRCDDVNGCPLATYVLSRLRQRLADDADIGAAVRLVSLSFDPANDTPETLREYAAPFGGQTNTWRFLTTNGPGELAPILEGYGQAIVRDPGGDAFSHLLRVFLIDRAQRIRNIYSVSFLHADALINDIRTLLMETAPLPAAAPAPRTETSAMSGPGDDRRGYEREDYRSRTRSLAHGAGRAIDLTQFVRQVPLGLPPASELNGNMPTPAQVALGRKLFYDRRLSGNGTISCAMCHIATQGFTSNEIETAVGIEGRTVKRNAPTLYNVGYHKRLFHDSREYRLEHQIWGPLLAANEMGNPSVGYVIERIRSMPDYAGAFEDAFAGRGPTMEHVGAALAAYERTLLSANSPFDRWYYGRSEDALDASAKRGFRIFTGKGNCVACHHIGPDHALFTDHALHNTGVGYARSMREPLGKQRVQIAPGTFVEVDTAVIADAAEPSPNDLGRYEVTGDPADRWRFRTPTLRNVALTAPYMHDGSLATLREVVEFYDQGGVANELLDPLLRPLGLERQEMDDLVAFLESLTGDNIELIVGDAAAAPIGDRE